MFRRCHYDLGIAHPGLAVKWCPLTKEKMVEVQKNNELRRLLNKLCDPVHALI